MTELYVQDELHDILTGITHEWRPASPLEVLAAARQLEGAEDIELLGPLLVVDRSDPDRDIALETGRYLVIPLGIEGEEGG